MTSCSSELRRARPLLGTFVEITARGRSPEDIKAGVESAFAAAQRVQAIMSFHDESSDVARLNRVAWRRAVPVDGWTFEVLTKAIEFSRLSHGAFDITMAPALVSWGLLPHRDHQASDVCGSWADIELLSRHRVRFRRRLTVDLGGIAKGFAVDKAVEALKSVGVESGVVNAGGDMRVFGSGAQTIHVRHPLSPDLVLPLLTLRDEALATSAPYFSKRRSRGRVVSALLNPSTRAPFTAPVSVSVRAPRCVTADALTKIVLAGTRNVESLLEIYDARAILLSAHHKDTFRRAT